MRKKMWWSYLDDDDHVVPKEQATQVRIVTTDENGGRVEVYGEIIKGPTNEDL